MKIVLTILFLIGILLAGCENHWFPWVNIGGVFLAGVSGILIDAGERHV